MGETQESEARLRLVIGTIPGLAWCAEGEGSANFFNQRWLDYTGLCLDEARGWGWTASIHPEDLPGLLTKWRELTARGIAGEMEARMRNAAGEYRWFLVQVSPFYDEQTGTRLWYGTNTDIQDRKLAEDALRRGEACLALGQKLTGTGSWGWEVSSGKLHWSEGTYRIFGLPLEMQPTLVNAMERIHPEDRRRVEEILDNAIAQREGWNFDARIILPQGTVRHVRVASRAESNAYGEVEFWGTVMDVTDQKETEDKLVQLNQALQTLHQCNLALIHATDEQELLNSICRILAEFGGFRMVWVGYRQNDEEKSIRPVAHAGQENGYLQDAAISWGDNDRGYGPSGTALRTGKPAWAKDIRDEQKFASWQERALARGYASSLALPLISRDETFGVLSLYSAEPGKFNEETFEQYLELAENLAYGIATLRTREDRKRTEEALRRSEAYLAEGQRLSHTGSWAWNVARQENVYWSDEQYRIYGFDPQHDPSTYKAAFERIHPEDRPEFLKRLEKALAGKHDFEVGYRVLLPDGTMKHLQTVGHPVLNDAGEVEELVGTGVDVTEQKRAEGLLSAEKRALEMIAAGAELKDVLQSVCDAMDAHGHNLISSVLLMDPDGKQLWPAAGRRVPLNWSAAITPLKIGPCAGSCGTAAHRKEQVIVSDIAIDPLWKEFREAALSHGLRACWSRPLISKNKEVLGTLANYFTEPRQPSEVDLTLMEKAAHAAQIAIERDRSQAALQKAFEQIKALKDRLYEENLALREEIDQASMFEQIVGTSPALQEVLSRVAKVAPSNSTVLITGETGTGKELVARAIHKRSQRAGRAFISVNCAAIPSALIASELFGHEKGAFTGALQRRIGRFELAEGGTIFLDEIGELSPETQIALLRVLQEREFERVGSSHSMSANVRVIAATNRDLAAAAAAGTFRMDLFYRLNVFPIDVPPLRQRAEDIPLLVRYFIDRYAQKEGKSISSIGKQTLDLLSGYHWPGNIRELQNVIERSVILCESDVFSAEGSWFAGQPASVSTPQTLLNKKLGDQERELIEAALAQTKGRVAGSLGAAARLGLPSSTLESKIRTLGIQKSKFKTA